MARGRHPTRIPCKPPDQTTAARYFRIWTGRELHRTPERFPPLTSECLFGTPNPLEIDFGCGTGALVRQRAALLPGVNFVGIDKSQKPLFFSIKEAVAASLENILFIRTDFNAILSLLQPGTLQNAYYLFPNPPNNYHEERANEHRRVFLQSIYDALEPGGSFYFATDSKMLFENVSTITHERLEQRTHPLDSNDAGIATWYGRIWERRGREVRAFAIRKG